MLTTVHVVVMTFAMPMILAAAPTSGLIAASAFDGIAEIMTVVVITAGALISSSAPEKATAQLEQSHALMLESASSR